MELRGIPLNNKPLIMRISDLWLYFIKYCRVSKQ